jgi:hypothetical protein
MHKRSIIFRLTKKKWRTNRWTIFFLHQTMRAWQPRPSTAQFLFHYTCGYMLMMGMYRAPPQGRRLRLCAGRAALHVDGCVPQHHVSDHGAGRRQPGHCSRYARPLPLHPVCATDCAGMASARTAPAGQYPMMTEAAAVAALESSARAYNHGQGGAGRPGCPLFCLGHEGLVHRALADDECGAAHCGRAQVCRGPA